MLRTIGTLTIKDVLPPALHSKHEARIAAATQRLVIIDQRISDIQRQLEDPDNALAVKPLIHTLATLEADKQDLVNQLKTMKLDSTTGRSETLAEAQTLTALLATKAGTAEEPDIRRRLKSAIRWLISEVWIITQPYNGNSVLVHAQLYFRSSLPVMSICCPSGTAQLRPPTSTPGTSTSCDFRAGDIGDAARVPQPDLASQ